MFLHITFYPPPSQGLPPKPGISRALREICGGEVLVTVFGDIDFSFCDIVAKEYVKDLLGSGGIRLRHSDKTPGGRVHGGLPHHVSLVFTKPLGALKNVLCVSDLGEDLSLFALVVGEVDIVFYGDLKKRRLGDIDLSHSDEGGHKAVEKGKQKGADLESVHRYKL